MELREISVVDVYPDEKNPRKDFGDIAALAESCMLNALNPGEPVNPIVVVEDGGIYRIIDGERRYKAIKKNKLSRCHAVVCDDMDEANAMVAMITTDDKQQLTDIERSRGVQQMLLLGVDPEKVDRVGRMDKGSAMKVNRAMLKIDDAAEDMTLDRLYAISEFVETGDGDAVEQLMNCSESEWRGVVESVKAERTKATKIAALEQACRDAGIAISEERLYRKEGWKWYKDVSDPEAIAPAVADVEGCTAYVLKDSYRGPEIELCKPIADGEEVIDPAQVERQRRIADVKGMIGSSRKNRLLWFHSRLDDLGSMPNVMEIVEESALFGYSGIGDNVCAFEDETGSKVDGAFCPLLAAYGYVRAADNSELNPYISQNLVGGRDSYYSSNANRFHEWLAAFEADGYEPTEVDLELKRLCETALTDNEEEE